MAKMGFEKRLENLERLTKVAWDSAHPVARYEALGEVTFRQLLQIVDEAIKMRHPPAK